MNKLLIVINGMARSGKDTFCNFVRDYSGHNTFIISSVDDVKEKAKTMGWDGVSKTEKDRKFLSDLKDLCTWYNDAPFNYIKEQIKYFYASIHKEIMFIHIREPQEIQKLKNEFPELKTLLITNKNVPNITTNSADASVYDYQYYDYIIKNDGTLNDLKEAALNFVNRFYEDNTNEIWYWVRND